MQQLSRTDHFDAGFDALAKTTESAGPRGLRVKYEHLARNKTPAVVEITLPGPTFPPGDFDSASEATS